MRKTILLIAVVLSISAMCHAQDTPKHPIDKTLEDCLDRESSTAGMLDCMSKAHEKWDKELNRVYNELMKRLNTQAKATLKAAQLEWLKFRDSEFKLIADIFSKMEGTMYIPMHEDSRMQIVKNRALELQSYLDLVKQ